MLQNKALAGLLLVATLLLAASAIYLEGTSLLRPVLASILLLAFVPLTFARHYDAHKKRRMASKIPIFLSDIERATRIGMPRHAALGMLAAKDYGELNPGLSQMKEEMSEGETFEHAIRNLADRLAGTHHYHVLHNLAHGGDLASAGRHLRELESIDGVHRLKYQAYTLAMYALLFTFAVSVTLVGKAYLPGSLPIQVIWIQAVFTGIATGKLAENSFLAGINHAILLVIIGTLPYLALS